MTCLEWLERAARDVPAGDAVVDGPRRRSYADVLERVRRLASACRARGLEPGDRVAILDDNSAAYLELYFALAAAGLVALPWNTRLTAGELASIAADADVRLLFARGGRAGGYGELVRAVVARSPTIAGVVWLDEPAELPIPTYDYERELERSAGALPRVADDPDTLAQLYYTSGTTGEPKGVMLTHANVRAHAEAAVDELELGAGDVWAHVAPLFHLADAWATFAVTLAGGRHVLLRRFDAAATLSLFERERVTTTNLVPTMLGRVLADPALATTDTSSLRRMLSGGAPIARATVARAMELLGCEYVQTYGLTETSPFLTFSLLAPDERALPADEQLALRAKTGRALRAVELRVVDESGRPVAANGRAVGEIQARGPTVTPGYWRRPDETARAFTPDGWFRTGDLATVDERGFVDIVDRKKDVVLSGGETVYSVEVESALYEHPAVLEAAVYGRPDADWGERVCAAVAFAPGRSASPDELERHCRERLAGYKVPRELRVLDALPRTGSGKIAKRALRADGPGPSAPGS